MPAERVSVSSPGYRPCALDREAREPHCIGLWLIYDGEPPDQTLMPYRRYRTVMRSPNIPLSRNTCQGYEPVAKPMIKQAAVMICNRTAASPNGENLPRRSLRVWKGVCSLTLARKSGEGRSRLVSGGSRAPTNWRSPTAPASARSLDRVGIVGIDSRRRSANRLGEASVRIPLSLTWIGSLPGGWSAKILGFPQDLAPIHGNRRAGDIGCFVGSEE